MSVKGPATKYIRIPSIPLGSTSTPQVIENGLPILFHGLILNNANAFVVLYQADGITPILEVLSNRVQEIAGPFLADKGLSILCNDLVIGINDHPAACTIFYSLIGV